MRLLIWDGDFTNLGGLKYEKGGVGFVWLDDKGELFEMILGSELGLSRSLYHSCQRQALVQGAARCRFSTLWGWGKAHSDRHVLFGIGARLGEHLAGEMHISEYNQDETHILLRILWLYYISLLSVSF